MKPTRRTSAPRPLKPGWTSFFTPKPQFTGCMPRKPMRAVPSSRQKPPICLGLLLFWGNSARFLRMSLLIRRRSIVNPRLPAKKEQFSRSHIPDAQAQKKRQQSQSKAQQKKAIRRQYMQAANGQPLPPNVPVSRAAEKAVETGASSVQKQVQTARKRRNIFAFILFAALLCYALNALNGCAPILESTMQVIAMTTYPAEEDDILAAERYYAQLESDLQHELDDYGALHPGCDEYQIEQMDIWHDPYVLISIISAAIGDEWKVDDAVPIMDRLFAQQYILTSSIASETRYRKEWKTGWKQELDPATGVLEWIPYDYEVDVPYIYKTCTVKLVNKNLSHLLFNVMSREQVGMYAVYISTHGNMPDLFRNNPYAGELKRPVAV